MNSIVTLKNIKKTYGKKTILEDVNLDIKSGDFITIFGKSGAGKSTLLNIIGTLEDYDSGNVLCFGKTDPIKNEKTSQLLRRKKIAYLFQNFALVDKMTVEENLKLALKYNDSKNKDLLIEDSLKKLRIVSKLNSKIYELSGGEAQRVALSRNIIKPFELMLADEPTGSLDDENKKIVIDNLIDLNNRGKTIVVVSHDKDFEKISSKNYYIENKRLKERI